MKKLNIKSERRANKSEIVLNINDYEKYLKMSRDEGLIIKKLWGTSVWMEGSIPMICERHLPYEKLGYVDLSYEYAPGLKFPYDPDCKDEREKTYCRCNVFYKILY